MTRGSAGQRIAGWLLAAAVALGLVGGVAAFALAAERRSNVLVLDLGTTPPSAPAIAAVSEAAPEVAASDPVLPEPPEPADPAPVTPDTAPRPMLAAAAPMTLPQIEAPVAADLSLPPEHAEPEAPHEPTVRPKVRPKAKPDPKPEPEKSKETKRKEPRPEKPSRAEKPASSASAPSAAAKPRGGDVSPAAYARAVMKKVRATKRKPGAGKGTVLIGFTIAPDGSLASVRILKSSGHAALDDAALDHIRRSAPFPPPPSGPRPGYSFEFVGK